MRKNPSNHYFMVSPVFLNNIPAGMPNLYANKIYAFLKSRQMILKPEYPLYHRNISLLYPFNYISRLLFNKLSLFFICQIIFKGNKNRRFYSKKIQLNTSIRTFLKAGRMRRQYLFQNFFSRIQAHSLFQAL